MYNTRDDRETIDRKGMFVMSCETNFHSFCARIAGAGSEVAAAFGGDPQQAVAALQHIFQIARNQERTVSPGATATAVRLSELQTQAQSRQAEDDTRRLFDDIRAAGLQPPTHSASGLPKPDAQRGYAAVYQTVRAIANRTTLPALAQQVAQAVRVSVPPPSSTLAQAQQTPHVAPRGVLAHVQQANGIVPGSPEFFKPWLGDISTGLSQCRTLREKAMDPVVAARCQQALHEAPSIIGLANGTHAYGGPQFQMEHAALVSLAEHSVATARWFGTIASTFKHKRHMPAQQQQGNVLKLAMVICEAAGIQRCPACGEFMGSSHTCPPTALTDRLTTAVALRAITDAPTLVDLANETHTFRKGGNVDKERSALRTAGYTLGGWERDTLPGIPPALHRLQQQWDRSESAAHAAAFAQALCEAAGLPRCPSCQGYLGDYHLCVPPAPPKLTGTAKKQVLVAASVVAHAPSLIDLANGAYTYGTGPDPQAEQAALTGAVQTFGRLKTAPAAFRAALERYQADRQVNATAFAQTSATAFAQELCTLAGVQRCQLCGQFRSTWHLCPNAAPMLPATEIGEQNLVGVASGGTPLTAAQFAKAEHVSIYGQPDPKVTVRGQTVTFNGRYYLPSEWSSARTKRLVPPSLEHGLRIGRSLPGALAVLQGATVVETADGYVQLYDGDCDKLLAVYHPRFNVVGSPGQPKAHLTPEQMAAVLAYRLRHPENALDDALIADVQALWQSQGSFPAVVDSAELVITRNVLRATSLVVNAALSVPRCPTCGQWMGDAHLCPVTATPQQRKRRRRRLDDAAHALEPGEQMINNQHLAKMYSAIASAIAGAPRRVIFGQPGSGFATDMKGKIFADPQPLGPTAPTAHQLVVIKQGVYHELGHEEFTPGEMWRRLLDLAQAPGPVEVEVDPTLAAIPSQAAIPTRTVEPTDPADAPAMLATLDAGRHMLPKIFNIIEDGGMERLIAARYAGAAEALAAGAAIYPRWHEQVGPGVPLVDEVIWPLLYTALPYFHVRDEVRAQMTAQGRQIFEEVEPIVANAVRGTPEDRFWATMEVTRRLEAYGLLQIPDAVATPPPPPSPGTAPFRGRPQRGGGSGGHGQPGQGSGHGGSAGGRGQAGGQAGGGGGQGGGGSGGSGGGQSPQSDPDDQRGRGRTRGRTPDDDERTGRRRGRGGADDDDERTGRPGGQEEDDAPGGGRGGAGEDDDQGGRQRGTEEDDAPGRGAAGGESEDAEDAAGGAAGDESGDADDDADGDPFGARSADEDDDEDDWDGDEDDWDGTWNDDAAANPTSSGAGSGGEQGPLSGGDWRSLRDPDRQFSPAEIADILDRIDGEATAAVDSGVRKAARVESLGRILNQPLTSTTEVRQRYRLPTGEVEAAQVYTRRGLGAGQGQALLARRAHHQNIARDLAMQLKAIREQVDKRFRFQNEGRLDRRRLVAAVKGAKDVHTRSERHPKTSFAASISVDLSGSMDSQKQSGALFDATMVLGDTFDQLHVPYEMRAFDHNSYQYKSLGDTVVDLERAGRLTADGGGGTSMAATASLATIALRAREEQNKLAIFLSDGDLSDHHTAVQILKDARQHGVLPYGIFLGDPPSHTRTRLDELYGKGNWRAINSLKEMPKVVGQHLAILYRALGAKGT